MESTRTRGRPGRPPGVRVNADGLTTRQRHIVTVIRDFVTRTGYPPTLREIGKAVGLSSTSSVSHQLIALEKKGVIRRDTHRPRAYALAGELAKSADTKAAPHTATVRVPLLGRITAVPITAEQDVADVLALPRRLVGSGEFFALELIDDAMTGAAIRSGDWVTVRRQSEVVNGDMVAAMVGGEAVVRRFELENGRVRLLPDHAAYEPVPGGDASVLGRVVAVMRRL
ncbi:transcriptional repressor LexA [Streptomyces sp. MMS24-I29]|uniref:transcriptional repressor LexA n=1 Tax=Streptomyces sp. MMS24-I29 TaxID=3351480 RepID=UPI003C7BC4C3